MRAGLSHLVINTRGFANTTNVRFAQMTDGADMQAPHIGAAIGNSLAPTDLDIESVEIIPGSASEGRDGPNYRGPLVFVATY